MNYFHVAGPGPVSLLSASGQSSNSPGGSTSIAGAWFQINQHLRGLTWQAILRASSAGATGGTTVNIEVSNDGINPLATKGQTLALTATTDLVSDGAVLATSMQGAWNFIRANMNSLTTSTAGSTGGGARVDVLMNAALG